MSAITLRRVGDEIHVRFPRELKDCFRLTFPSATWSPSLMVWTLGGHMQARLEDWMEEVEISGILAELQAAAGRHLGAEERDSIRKEIARIRLARNPFGPDSPQSGLFDPPARKDE